MKVTLKTIFYRDLGWVEVYTGDGGTSAIVPEREH
jgi:hypothetical protein